MWVSADGEWDSLLAKMQIQMCKLKVYYRLTKLQEAGISYKLATHDNDYYIYLVKDITYVWPTKVCEKLNMLKYCFFNVTGTYLKLKNPFVCTQCIDTEKIYVVQILLPICIFCSCYISQFIEKFILRL
jgi:hypothetical protein